MPFFSKPLSKPQSQHSLHKLDFHINEPEFADAVVIHSSLVGRGSKGGIPMTNMVVHQQIKK